MLVQLSQDLQSVSQCHDVLARTLENALLGVGGAITSQNRAFFDPKSMVGVAQPEQSLELVSYDRLFVMEMTQNAQVRTSHSRGESSHHAYPGLPLLLKSKNFLVFW